MATVTAGTIDEQNRLFWDELCGSCLARHIGITDHSAESLQRFDAAYLDFYPYLLGHVRPEEMAGKTVLEVGLGYGTLGQCLATAGARYHGLDVAEGPVRMMNARLSMLGLAETAVQGSVLDCPLGSASVDFVVSIGCFHHTGDVARAIDETYRVLKPAGTAVLMVYNRFSARQWHRWPLQTFLALCRDWRLWPAASAASADQRRSYDCNQAREAAPDTVFTSIRQLRRMLRRFRQVRCWKENCEDVVFRGEVRYTRKQALPWLGRLLGLDIYVRAVK
jgi:SAM-dependent methyltransferase